MKITLIGPVYPYRGGIAHYTTRLYQTLEARGHDVQLISFKRLYPSWLYPGESDKDPSADTLNVEAARYWLDTLNPLTWLKTWRHIQHHRPHVLVLQWWTPFLAPIWLTMGLINARFASPSANSVVFICHNVLPHEPRPWDIWLARQVLRHSKVIITQSEEEKNTLATLLPAHQCTVVPHPIYDMFFEKKISVQQAREILRLPLDIPVLLFFGIVRPYKGLDCLLQALPLIRKRWGRVLVLVAGEFWEGKQRYLEMITTLGISEDVRIDDRYIPNEEVVHYFSSADVLVAPYRQVTGSGVVQMAKGFQVPVISTRISNLADLVEEGVNGYLAPPENPAALADAIIYYLEHGLSQAQPAAEPSNTQQDWDTLAAAVEEVGS